jgi:hypothetical protein
MSLAAQAEHLRLSGFTIRSLTADQLLVEAPTLGNATIFDIMGWLRGPSLCITRTEAGLTMTPQPAIARMAVGSVFPGLTLGAIFIHSPLRAIAVGFGASLAAFAYSYTTARRRKPTMLQFAPTTKLPDDQDPEEDERR